jgi:hypothetical protein
MKKLFVLLLAIMSFNSFAVNENTTRQVRMSLTKASWSLDALDYAIKNSKSAAACQSLGVVQYIIKDLKQRTFEGGMATGSIVKDNVLIQIIKNLSSSSTVCTGVDTLSAEDMSELETLRIRLKSDFKIALLNI